MSSLKSLQRLRESQRKMLAFKFFYKLKVCFYLNMSRDF